MRILTVVGARPQFVKAAMVSHAILRRNDASSDPHIEETIIHTGQHYDDCMSRIFFDDLSIPAPAVNLEVGSGPHGETTGKMLAGLEREIQQRAPDGVLVYGDTNSTLAAALAAAKLHVPVAHIEAGLRSFNRRMPEEVNRVLTDHVANLLCCPTETAVEHLRREGIEGGVVFTGDVMFDAALHFGALADERSRILETLELDRAHYHLATIHRAENTDDPQRLRGILRALGELASAEPVVLPLHPRTKARMASAGLEALAEHLRIIEPVSFLDMIHLERHARLILTDSGGVQKEAFFHGVPCVTLRDETEWTETVEAGWNRLTGADTEAILDAARNAAPGRSLAAYGDGAAADAVVRALLAHADAGADA
ncbi:MAG: non-hydrolyzing UDP-N-acetylglucosamine 2-epimerase [Planctomycetota bacterium]